MPDTYAVQYRGNPCLVNASRREKRKVFNLYGGRLNYANSPDVSGKDAALEAGQSVTVDEPTWLHAAARDVKVMVDSAPPEAE